MLVEVAAPIDYLLLQFRGGGGDLGALRLLRAGSAGEDQADGTGEQGDAGTGGQGPRAAPEGDAPMLTVAASTGAIHGGPAASAIARA